MSATTSSRMQSTNDVMSGQSSGTSVLGFVSTPIRAGSSNAMRARRLQRHSWGGSPNSNIKIPILCFIFDRHCSSRFQRGQGRQAVGLVVGGPSAQNVQRYSHSHQHAAAFESSGVANGMFGIPNHDACVRPRSLHFDSSWLVSALSPFPSL